MQAEEFRTDLEAVLQRARQAGVKAIITASVDLPDAQACLALATHHDLLHPAIGLAPYSDLSQLEAVISLINQHSQKLAAIGEIGLDYAWQKHPEQVGPFRRQVELARELDLAVSIHSRSAGKYVLDELSDLRAGKVHLHAFSGSLKDVRRAIDLGYYLSVTARVVNSERVQQLAMAIPEELLLIETDSPVLSPFEGRNEPANLAPALQKLSELKGIPSQELEHIIDKNAEKLFKLRN